MLLRKLFQLSLFERFQQPRSTVVVSVDVVTAPRRPRRATRPRSVQRNPADTALPDIRGIWEGLVHEWFPERLDLLEYAVSWSSRPQKRTLASCNPFRRQISVARELQNPQYAEFLPALIYHEMCHAYLGKDLPRRNGKRPWHGREFKALERRHPGIPALNHWIKTRGWEHAVRSDRAKRAHARRAASR